MVESNLAVIRTNTGSWPRSAEASRLLMVSAPWSLCLVLNHGAGSAGYLDAAQFAEIPEPDLLDVRRHSCSGSGSVLDQSADLQQL